MRLTDKLTDIQFDRLVIDIQKLLDAQSGLSLKSVLSNPWQFLYRKCAEDYPQNLKLIKRDLKLIKSSLYKRIKNKVKFDRNSSDEKKVKSNSLKPPKNKQ